MDRHVSTTMVGARIPWDTHDALKKVAKDRDVSVNALLVAMINTMLFELSQEEEW